MATDNKEAITLRIHSNTVFNRNIDNDTTYYLAIYKLLVFNRNIIATVPKNIKNNHLKVYLYVDTYIYTYIYIYVSSTNG